MPHTPAQIKEVRVAFYNVENLFDTIDDPKTMDDEYLPNSDMHWDTDRYRRKIEHIAKVINALHTKHSGPPMLVGLAEVENDFVLNDLVSHHSLSNSDYGFIHYESPDERGIDVALLYRKSMFEVVNSEHLEVALHGDDQTREILHVEGLLSGVTIHVFVNHWPSRREGVKESEPNRVAAAKVLREAVDEVLRANPKANILIMGDFNDEPANLSIIRDMDARMPKGQIRRDSLYNLSYKEFSKGKGTYFFKPQKSWMMFDQMMVSGNMLSDGNVVQVVGKSTHVFDAHFLMYHQKGVGDVPNRTYGGKSYHGGYSDHLPIYLDLKMNR